MQARVPVTSIIRTSVIIEETSLFRAVPSVYYFTSICIEDKSSGSKCS